MEPSREVNVFLRSPPRSGTLTGLLCSFALYPSSGALDPRSGPAPGNRAPDPTLGRERFSGLVSMYSVRDIKKWSLCVCVQYNNNSTHPVCEAGRKS